MQDTVSLTGFLPYRGCKFNSPKIITQVYDKKSLVVLLNNYLLKTI